ncbi:MAG: response regulator transcription factor [Planctomycetaceae bacterium]|nr:response regulator transcription factor [Planctomycetaceae bacterium]
MITASKSPSERASFVIVDDHELIRLGLARLIAMEPGWSVCGEAEDVHSAIKLIGDKCPTLAIVDLRLKAGDGLELIRQVSRLHPDVLTLVLSVHDEELFAGRAIRAGAHGFINKQEPASTLISAIKQVLAGRSYLSPRMTEKLLSEGMRRKPNTSSSPLKLLSDRELEVYERLGRGMSTKEIARDLHLSDKTVQYHREHIKEKLQLPTASAVLRHATAWCLSRDR